MANKQEKITLTIDFNIEKAKLQELSKILNVDIGGKLKGNTALSYFETARTGVNDLQKTVNKLYTTLQKPLTSKNQAKELANGIQTAFESLDRKLLSLQGNIFHTFNSASNVNALKQIRQLGDEIDNLTADYKKASQLLSESRGLGSKTTLKATLSTSQKELSILNKKEGNLTAQEITRQKELLQIIEETNAALAEKLAIAEKVAAIQATHGATSQAGMSSLIQGKVDEQRGLIEGSISPQELNTLKQVLQDVRKLLIDIKNTSNATVPAIGDNWDDVTYKNRQAVEQAKTFKQVLMELGLPALSLAGLARGFREVARYSYDYVKNLDAALTEIAIVSGKSREEVLRLTDTFIELSSRTGMAIDDIAQASTIFYQQGLNDEAVAKMTEYTAMFAKISNETVETAADQITAAINGFNMGVDQAGDVIDKLSVLAAYSAADIDELATAMSKAASQASMAGLSFDEYNAYLATMIETTREAPENLGTSLKTIMSRFQAIKTGDNTEDDVDVNQVEKALKTVGVHLRDENGILRDLGDVLNELGPKWNSLNRNTQAYLGTIIAGTRQQSRFISLMQNWDRALELTEASQNSAGAAARMHASAMEGLDASINNLTITWQKFISSVVNGNTFKGLIDVATGLLKFISQGNSLANVFATIMTIFSIKTIASNLALVKAKDSIRNLDTALGSLGTMFNKVYGDMQLLTTAEGLQIQKLQEEKLTVDALTNAYIGLNTARQGGTPVLMLPAGTGTTDVPKAPQTPLTKKEQLKNFGGNVASLLGKIQTVALITSIATSVSGLLTDLLVKTSDEIREEAEKIYDEQQKEINKWTNIVQTVESSGEVYEKLSKKVNKSTEEMEQMANAANELAEAIPGAVIGYDAMGNAIISMNAANAAKQEANDKIVQEASTQIGNVAKYALADVREQAENKVKTPILDIGASSGLTAGLSIAGGVIGGTALGAKIGTFLGTAVAPGVGTAVGAAVGAAIGAGIGLLTNSVSAHLKEVKISNEEARIAAQKAQTILSEETNQKILENLSLITNATVSQRTTNGVSAGQKINTASWLQDAWQEDRINQILADSIKKGKLDEDAFTEALEGLGAEWQAILARIGDDGLAAATKGLEKVAVGLGDKTYAATEEAITKIITDDMGISSSDPLFTAIKNALLNAAYEGLGIGVNTIIKDLENRKSTAASQGEDTAKYDKAINMVKNGLTNTEAGFYDSIGLTDNIDMMLIVLEQYGTQIENALVRSTEAASVQTIAVLGDLKRKAEQKMKEIGDTNSKEYKRWEAMATDAANSIEQAWAQMDISVNIPWEQLWTDLEKLTKSANTSWETLHALNKEGIDVKQWKEFTTALDEVDLSTLSDEQLVAYAQGLDTIENSLTVVNGKITANGKAVEAVAKLQSMAVQASIDATKQELQNKKIELEAQKAIVDATVATLEYKVAEAEGSAEAETKKIAAQKAWNTASEKINTIYVKNQGKVAAAMVNAYADGFAAILTKYNQLQTAMADGKILQDEINAVNAEWTALTKDLNFDSYVGKLDEGNYSLDTLKSMLAAAKNESKLLGVSIEDIELKLKTLNLGLFTTKNGTGDASKAAKEYVGKLKEIYNILNRIQLLEHRRDMLDNYADIEEGEMYAQHMQERMALNDELIDQYDFLVKEQKAFANGYAQFIESSSLADVFSFDEFGQIIVDFEKYNALSTEAAEGLKSMKEQADELYDGYTEMYEDVMEYANDYLDTIKAQIDAHQAVVDDYVDVEEQAADAIKEIYQKILDDKLEAIDKEIEALEDLRKAREEANKEQENAKEVSGLQTDLQRAMMDTSGASDSAQIKARQELGEKLDSIAEDKYSEMLENLQIQLEDEKEMLQEEFDEMFENLEWLYAMLETNFMTDQSKLEDLWKQTDEWNQAAPARRKEMMDDLDKKYNHYMKELQNGKSILDVCNEIDELQTKTKEVETALKNQMINTGGQIAAAIATMSTGGGHTSSPGPSYTPTSPTTTDPGSVTLLPEPSNNNNTEITKAMYGLAEEGGAVYPKTNKVIGLETCYEYKNGKMVKATPMWVGTDKVEGKNGGYNHLNKTIVGSDTAKYVDGVWYYKFKTAFAGDRWLPASRVHIINPQRIVTPDFNWASNNTKAYKTGGFADFTGPAWLDGTPQKPEAVLNALQTEHFMKFTNALDNMYGQMGGPSTANSIMIDTISFNVDSMSSPEDGEAAFDMFVNKFKEIGSQRGMKINNFKNIL